MARPRIPQPRREDQHQERRPPLFRLALDRAGPIEDALDRARRRQLAWAAIWTFATRRPG